VPPALRSVVDTDDVLHDVLVRGLRRLPMLRFADESWLLAYLHRAVMNRLTDLHRRALRVEIGRGPMTITRLRRRAPSTRSWPATERVWAGPCSISSTP
jgi:DNA-directed RNA polymerase specialized sigma24 family protein